MPAPPDQPSRTAGPGPANHPSRHPDIAPWLVVVAFLAAVGLLGVALAQRPGGAVAGTLATAWPWLVTVTYLVALAVFGAGIPLLLHGRDETTRHRGRGYLLLSVPVGVLAFLAATLATRFGIPVAAAPAPAARVVLQWGAPAAILAGLIVARTAARRGA